MTTNEKQWLEDQITEGLTLLRSIAVSLEFMVDHLEKQNTVEEPA